MSNDQPIIDHWLEHREVLQRRLRNQRRELRNVNKALRASQMAHEIAVARGHEGWRRLSELQQQKTRHFYGRYIKRSTALAYSLGMLLAMGVLCLTALFVQGYQVERQIMVLEDQIEKCSGPMPENRR